MRAAAAGSWLVFALSWCLLGGGRADAEDSEPLAAVAVVRRQLVVCDCYHSLLCKRY